MTVYKEKMKTLMTMKFQLFGKTEKCVIWSICRTSQVSDFRHDSAKHWRGTEKDYILPIVWLDFLSLTNWRWYRIRIIHCISNY